MRGFIKKLIIFVLIVIILVGTYFFTKSDVYVWRSKPGESYTPVGQYLTMFSSDGGIYSKAALQNMNLDTSAFEYFEYTTDYYFVAIRMAPQCDYIFGRYFQFFKKMLYIDCFSQSFTMSGNNTVWMIIVPLENRIIEYKGSTFLKKPVKFDLHDGLDKKFFIREVHKGTRDPR